MNIMNKKDRAKLVKDLVEVIPTSNTLANCNLVGVQYDAKAINAIQIIATGLVENAKGLSKLAEVLKASNVTIESMIKLEGNK